MFQIFKSILLLSAVGTALTAFLLLIKPYTQKHFSSSWQYYIWLVVLTAMILPVKLPKRPAEVDLTGTVTPAVTMEAVSATPEPLPYIEAADGNPVPVADIEKRGFNLNFYDIISAIWLIGAVIFILCALFSYWLFLLRKRKSSSAAEEYIEFLYAADRLNVKRTIPLKKSNDFTAPMLVGIFRPVIYVPYRDISSEELTMIFMHELTHYKRRDLWYKWFSLIVNAIHWFNPFIYIAVKNINEACELSCDESVTRDMTDAEKKLYMRTIIGLIKKGDKENV